MQVKKRKIVVMGLGYIGLPTASMLATKGHQVLGVEPMCVLGSLGDINTNAATATIDCVVYQSTVRPNTIGIIGCVSGTTKIDTGNPGIGDNRIGHDCTWHETCVIKHSTILGNTKIRRLASVTNSSGINTDAVG